MGGLPRQARVKLLDFSTDDADASRDDGDEAAHPTKHGGLRIDDADQTEHLGRPRSEEAMRVALPGRGPATGTRHPMFHSNQIPRVLPSEEDQTYMGAVAAGNPPRRSMSRVALAPILKGSPLVCVYQERRANMPHEERLL